VNALSAENVSQTDIDKAVQVARGVAGVKSVKKRHARQVTEEDSDANR
jgi:hypothetical protein